jgi:nicotinamide/nicotinate riboside kinase
MKGTLTIAVSGSSGAGKTSFTALLGKLLPAQTIYIHADAFGKDFDDLPTHEGTLDADSRLSVHFDALQQTIRYAKLHGRLPDTYKSFDFIELDLQRAERLIQPEYLESVKPEISRSGIDWDAYSIIVVVDGFLLYHIPELRKEFDVKLLMRTTKEEARLRRFRRYGGKVYLEGSEEFWKTDGYFDRCVWRNYELEHAPLFPNGNVDVVVDDSLDVPFGIRIQPIPDQTIEQTQLWAMRALLHSISMPGPTSS